MGTLPPNPTTTLTQLNAVGQLMAEELIALREGLRLKLYNDANGAMVTVSSPGNITIGYGTNVSHGISNGEAAFLLRTRLVATEQGLIESRSISYRPQNAARKIALLDLGYNFGIEGLESLTTFLTLLAAGEYEKAHDDLLTTQWAQRDKTRALFDAELINTGKWVSP